LTLQEPRTITISLWPFLFAAAWMWLFFVAVYGATTLPDSQELLLFLCRFLSAYAGIQCLCYFVGAIRQLYPDREGPK